MFTPEELKPGAKRAVLEYIAENGVPVAKIYSSEYAKKLDPKADLIVRADNARQWDAFSGIYGSYMTCEKKLKLKGPNSGECYTSAHFTLKELIAIAGLDEEFSSGNRERDALVVHNVHRTKRRIGWYCRQLGLPSPEKPNVLIQDAHSESIAMFQHPSNPNLVVIGINERTVLYDRADDSFTYLAPPDEWEVQSFERMPTISRKGGDFGRLRETVKIFDKVVSLPKFSDIGSTFEMESGWHRDDGNTVVYQVKPFRKVEKASFRLEPESGKRVFNFDLPVGIAPVEGVRLENKRQYYSTAFPDAPSPDFYGSVSLVWRGGYVDDAYPHVAMPGISALLYPIFDYRRSHGARESLMKTPLALCDVSEFDGTLLGQKRGTRSKDFEVPNIRVQDWELAEKLQEMLIEGQILRLYSDGITGRVVIE